MSRDTLQFCRHHALRQQTLSMPAFLQQATVLMPACGVCDLCSEHSKHTQRSLTPVRPTK